MSNKEDSTRFFSVRVDNAGHSIYRRELDGEVVSLLRKIYDVPSESASSDKSNKGRVPHPFGMSVVDEFDESSPYHTACIEAKAKSTVGLGIMSESDKDVNGDGMPDKGFEPSNVDTILNPLTMETAQSVLNDLAEDYFKKANAYMEIKRELPNGKNGNSRIVGVHHIQAHKVWAFVEEDGVNHHFEVESEKRGTLKMPAFGDSVGFLERNPDLLDASDVSATGNSAAITEVLGVRYISEIIAFRSSSSKSKWYGIPKWISAVPSIELGQMMDQYFFDFFNNRGVPEFIIIIKGGVISDAEWVKVENTIKANIGSGNAFKSCALNFSNSNVEVQIEKLGVDSSREDFFPATSDSLAMRIVTAHQVPPLLAGILIPGKLGATNELPNALRAFQILVIGPAQVHFQQVLGATLGNPKKNGGLGLAPKDFSFRRITDAIDVNAMDTSTRMREPEGSGRDPKDGLKND